MTYHDKDKLGATRGWIENLATRLFGQPRYVYSVGHVLLLKRWYVWPSRKADSRVGRPFAIFLHLLVNSDDVRDLHDHPWSFLGLTLGGFGYTEIVPADDGLPRRKRITRMPWSWAFRPAEWPHAVELRAPQWTLIITARRRRTWGFHTRQGWQSWIEYVDLNQVGSDPS